MRKSPYDSLEVLSGRTIASVEVVPAEFGRTYDSYICLTTTDGRRVMLAGKGVKDPRPYEPRPNIEDMKKAPVFFSADEIADRVRDDEVRARHRRRQDTERKRRELERLQRELGTA